MNDTSVPLRKVAASDEADLQAPHLLVYSAKNEAATLLVEQLQTSGDDVQTFLVEPPVSARRLPAMSIDVAATCIDGGGDALVFATELGDVMPWVQLVFWTEQSRISPSNNLARRLGISPLMSSPQLNAWLPKALAPLTRMARAKRSLWEAEAEIPAAPTLDNAGASLSLVLPEAERQFRETYLRCLLQHTPNTRRAAERAGVPYTTLCSMLKKLGLKRDGLERTP